MQSQKKKLLQSNFIYSQQQHNQIADASIISLQVFYTIKQLIVLKISFSFSQQAFLRSTFSSQKQLNSFKAYPIIVIRQFNKQIVIQNKQKPIRKRGKVIKFIQNQKRQEYQSILNGKKQISLQFNSQVNANEIQQQQQMILSIAIMKGQKDFIYYYYKLSASKEDNRLQTHFIQARYLKNKIGQIKCQKLNDIGSLKQPTFNLEQPINRIKISINLQRIVIDQKSNQDQLINSYHIQSNFIYNHLKTKILSQQLSSIICYFYQTFSFLQILSISTNTNNIINIQLLIQRRNLQSFSSRYNGLFANNISDYQSFIIWYYISSIIVLRQQRQIKANKLHFDPTFSTKQQILLIQNKQKISYINFIYHWVILALKNQQSSSLTLLFINSIDSTISKRQSDLQINKIMILPNQSDPHVLLILTLNQIKQYHITQDKIIMIKIYQFKYLEPFNVISYKGNSALFSGVDLKQSMLFSNDEKSNSRSVFIINGFQFIPKSNNLIRSRSYDMMVANTINPLLPKQLYYDRKITLFSNSSLKERYIQPLQNIFSFKTGNRHLVLVIYDKKIQVLNLQTNQKLSQIVYSAGILRQIKQIPSLFGSLISVFAIDKKNKRLIKIVVDVIDKVKVGIGLQNYNKINKVAGYVILNDTITTQNTNKGRQQGRLNIFNSYDKSSFSKLSYKQHSYYKSSYRPSLQKYERDPLLYTHEQPQLPSESILVLTEQNQIILYNYLTSQFENVFPQNLINQKSSGNKNHFVHFSNLQHRYSKELININSSNLQKFAEFKQSKYQIAIVNHQGPVQSINKITF